MISDKVLLKVQNLKKYFPVKASYFSTQRVQLKAVDNVNFDLYKGETLGLVGESGCGKTTLGRCMLRLYDTDTGRIWLEPDESLVAEVSKLDEERMKLLESSSSARAETPKKNLVSRLGKNPLLSEIAQLKKQADELASSSDLMCMDKKTLKSARCKIQLIFQDPWSSLNPHQLVKDIISEGPREYDRYQGESLDSWVTELLDKVGLSRTVANRYPHEFSGGQRQRICIARALSLSPKIIVCDEPVSALDVSIQAQVLNLLMELQEEFDLTYLFIAHDLSVVEYMADRVAVMYLGKIIEFAESGMLYQNPRHPYTQSLFSAIPIADPDIQSRQIILEGDVPSPVTPPSGCSFHTRCRYKTQTCTEITPQLISNDEQHFLACHNPPNG